MLAAAIIPPRIIITPRAAASPGSISSKQWNELTTKEKVLVGTVGAVMFGAFIATGVALVKMRI